MLKILQISNKAPYPANDGSSIAILNMARGLAENGAFVKLVAINTKKHFKPDDGMPAELRKELHYQSVYRNTNITAAGAVLNLFTRSSYFVSRFRFRKFASVLRQALSEEAFDIVQVEGLFMAAYVPVIRKNSKAKIVLRAHNIEHVIWSRHIGQEDSTLKRWYLSLQNRRLRRYELRVFGEVDAVIPITVADERHIRELGCRTPLFTCITGIRPSEYEPPPGIAQKNQTVFYFGSMDWMPNQEAVTWFLDNCWDQVKAAVPQARFIIAGRGMPLHFFHINKPGVTLIEQVDDPHRFYHTYQVMVVPLWSGSGLRIKIVEGMASGRAIVSTTIGAEGIACTHGSDILIADTAADFSAAVISLLTDGRKREAIGRNAARLATVAFDNSRLVSELVRFYGTIA